MTPTTFPVPPFLCDLEIRHDADVLAVQTKSAPEAELRTEVINLAVKTALVTLGVPFAAFAFEAVVDWGWLIALPLLFAVGSISFMHSRRIYFAAHPICYILLRAGKIHEHEATIVEVELPAIKEVVLYKGHCESLSPGQPAKGEFAALALALNSCDEDDGRMFGHHQVGVVATWKIKNAEHVSENLSKALGVPLVRRHSEFRYIDDRKVVMGTRSMSPTPDAA